MNLFSLAGKTALITGGSKGLGFEMARYMCHAGAAVVITSRHMEEVAEAAASIREETGGRVLGLEADAADERAVEATVSRAVREFGSLDVLVNNAGINIHSYVHEQPLEDWEKVLRVDLTGPMLYCRYASRQMMEQHYGRIINISSILGMVGYVKRGPYCAAKGALINLTRCYAIELASYNITVNCICPGPFETPMTSKLVQGDTRLDFTSRIPLGRWGQPRELAGAVIYFASDAGAFTTGSILAVDGGWTAQ